MPICRKQTCFSTPAESVFHCYSVKSGYTDITATKTVFIFIDITLKSCFIVNLTISIGIYFKRGIIESDYNHTRGFPGKGVGIGDTALAELEGSVGRIN